MTQRALRREEMWDTPPALPRPLDGLPPAYPRRGPFTRPDFDACAATTPCELIDGHLLACPRPTLVHTAVCAELARRLGAWSERCCASLLGAESAPTALGERSIVRPDVALALRWRERATRADRADRAGGAERTPELLVEVLDGGDARRERELKAWVYAEAGVREYWIVDPGSRTVDFLVLHCGRFTFCPPEDGLYRSRSLPGLVFDAVDLWWDVEQLAPLAL